MRVLLVHSDDRLFEVERFGGAWALAGGEVGELLSVTPATSTDVFASPHVVVGLLLTGGPDVEPWRCGATPDEGVELHCRPERDALDLELLARAETEHWPVLAVCYGCQILNVFYGGTLIQDLGRVGKPGHQVKDPKNFLAHTVKRCGREGGRWLKPLPAEFAVNSRHHQAIGRVGPPLEVVGLAPDGVIEAIELREDARFVLGVQWHPENLTQPEHVAIFRAFRQACRQRSAEGAVATPRPKPGLQAPDPGVS